MDETNGPGPENPLGGRAPADDEASLVDGYLTSLDVFYQEVTTALSELDHEVPRLTVSMKKRPDDILSMLPQILPFEQMSFLELQYALPGSSRKTPGIRFWLEGPLREKRLQAILFKDTVVWNVSHDLDKLYTELGTFFLKGAEIVACPASALSGKPVADSDWKVLLRTVLRAPLL
jgi:hypothetical protein